MHRMWAGVLHIEASNSHPACAKTAGPSTVTGLEWWWWTYIKPLLCSRQNTSTYIYGCTCVCVCVGGWGGRHTIMHTWKHASQTHMVWQHPKNICSLMHSLRENCPANTFNALTETDNQFFNTDWPAIKIQFAQVLPQMLPLLQG